MTKTMSVTSIGILAFAIIVVAGLPAPAQATFSLLWSDEFNGADLDINNWNIDIGDGCPNLCGWGNNELPYYRAENVTVTNGTLIITTMAEPDRATRRHLEQPRWIGWICRRGCLLLQNGCGGLLKDEKDGTCEVAGPPPE